MNLTDDDLQAIRGLMVSVAREEARDVVKEEIGFLPTKDEFYKENDKLAKLLKTSRQEQQMHNVRLRDHEVRISKLEARRDRI